jgi:predicted aspartyl protease
MRAPLTRVACRAALALCLGATVTVATHAQETQPSGSGVLTGRNLTKTQGSTWVVENEATILNAFKDAQVLAARLKRGEAQLADIESGSQDPKAVVQSYREQVAMLGQQMSGIDQQLRQLAGSPIPAAGATRNMFNQQRSLLAREQGRLNAEINNLNTQGPEFEKQKQQFTAEIERLRKESKESVDSLRESVGKAMAKYAELEKDEPVVKALAGLSKETKTRQKLGPSKDLLNVVKWLGGSTAAQTETIELHREGDVDHIDVQLNGRTVRMVLDTTAAQTTLPAALATKLGLKPTSHAGDSHAADAPKPAADAPKPAADAPKPAADAPKPAADAPKPTLEPAAAAAGREMTIPTVRVGKMTARDVTCLVLPEEKSDVAPVLGQSFLKHFDYKHMKDAGRLVLTRVEPADAPKPAGKATAKAKARSSGRQPRVSGRSKSATGKRRQPAQGGDPTGTPAEPPG